MNIATFLVILQEGCLLRSVISPAVSRETVKLSQLSKLLQVTNLQSKMEAFKIGIRSQEMAWVCILGLQNQIRPNWFRMLFPLTRNKLHAGVSLWQQAPENKSTRNHGQWWFLKWMLYNRYIKKKKRGDKREEQDHFASQNSAVQKSWALSWLLTR